MHIQLDCCLPAIVATVQLHFLSRLQATIHLPNSYFAPNWCGMDLCSAAPRPCSTSRSCKCKTLANTTKRGDSKLVSRCMWECKFDINLIPSKYRASTTNTPGVSSEGNWTSGWESPVFKLVEDPSYSGSGQRVQRRGLNLCGTDPSPIRWVITPPCHNVSS